MRSLHSPQDMEKDASIILRKPVFGFSDQVRHEPNCDSHFCLKVPKTTIAEFVNTLDQDETAHNDSSHLDLQCLPSSH